MNNPIERVANPSEEGGNDSDRQTGNEDEPSRYEEVTRLHFLTPP
jgi:hypothetical protein